MLNNYLKIAIRILVRNKVYVAINVLSLGFALACCIWTYLNYNFRASFDTNHANTDNIYRVNSLRNVENSSQPWAVAPLPLAEAIAANQAGIERSARLYQKSAVVRKNENSFSETIYYADQ